MTHIVAVAAEPVELVIVIKFRFCCSRKQQNSKLIPVRGWCAALCCDDAAHAIQIPRLTLTTPKMVLMAS
jgi:hypothetical protein